MSAPTPGDPAGSTPLGCPLTKGRATDLYFMEHRGKVLDLAAFLDRVERAAADGGPGERDPRLVALREAVALLIDGKPERARRVLELLSDPTTEPIPAAPTKGATGVYAPKHTRDTGGAPR